jgi:HK97 family phage portal protein
MAIETLSSLALSAGHDIGAVRAYQEIPSEDVLYKGWPSGLFGAPSKSGVHVTEESALNYATVYTCVRIISETVATLPKQLYRDTGDSRDQAKDHYLYQILKHTPNPHQTAVQFWETYCGHMDLWGNGYALLDWNGAGRLRAMYNLHPGMVAPVLRRGVLSYDITSKETGQVQNFPWWAVMHTPLFGTDGLSGLSPIGLLRESIGLSMAAQEYASRFYSNNAQPGIVLESAANLKPEDREQLRKEWKSIHAGLKGAHETGVLSGGLSIKVVGIPQKDAQFLESRSFQRTELYGAYRMPAHMAGDLTHATFTNIEHQDIAFGKHCISPHCSRIEAAIKRSILWNDPDLYFEFNLDGLMRGDLLSRADASTKLVTSGQLTPNEARKLDNRKALPGGDELYMQQQMMPIGGERNTNGTSIV